MSEEQLSVAELEMEIAIEREAHQGHVFDMELAHDFRKLDLVRNHRERLDRLYQELEAAAKREQGATPP